jgi:ATP/ADP translocase
MLFVFPVLFCIFLHSRFNVFDTYRLANASRMYVVFSVGTTTVLTMAFLALDSRSDLPRVKYATALDLYIGLCFVFVLSAIVQFAIVHRYTKHGHGDVEPTRYDNDDEDEEESGDESVVSEI